MADRHAPDARPATARVALSQGPLRPETPPLDPAKVALLDLACAYVGRGALAMIDHANHKPENKGGKPKVGGHQASSLSSLQMLTALYLHVLRPGDRVAVKPHAAPVLYSLMHLLGRLPTAKMSQLRELGGPQPYPTPAKNPDFVDYTSSSEGLGVAATIYDALELQVQNRMLRGRARAEGATVPDLQATNFALCGDGELTEGQVDESLYDAGRWQLPGLVWIIDCNRQSLDRVLDDAVDGEGGSGRLDAWIEAKFRAQGWQTEQLREGRQLRALLARPGGDALQAALRRCSDAVFQALLLLDGAALRALLLGEGGLRQAASERQPGLRLLFDSVDALWPLGTEGHAGVARCVEGVADDVLRTALHDLGGHDVALLADACQRAAVAGRPVCLIAHTVKGFGSSLAGHPENHGALMPAEEALAFGSGAGVPALEPWPRPPVDSALGLLLGEREALLLSGPANAPFDHRPAGAPLDVEAALAGLRAPARTSLSSGEAFQSLNAALLRSPAGALAVFAAPDVGQTTHLGPIIKEHGVFAPRDLPDTWAFLRAGRAVSFDWRASPFGQFHALGIAEGNAMLWAGAMGRPRKRLEGRMPLLPVVTVYDKFVERALNQLDVALYSGSRFILVGVPSGTGLSRETFTHQSVATPRMVMDTPGICAWEPAFAADLAAIYRYALADLWREGGEAHYLRLTTQPLEQPTTLPADHTEAAIRGGYWLQGADLHPPEPGRPTVLFAASGRKVACARRAAARLHAEDGVGCRVLNVTSWERLWRSWDAWAQNPAAWRDDGPGHALDDLFDDDALLAAPLIVAIDAAPSVAEWLTGALQRVHPARILAPRRWGEAGDLDSVDRLHGMHADDLCTAARAELALRQNTGERKRR